MANKSPKRKYGEFRVLVEWKRKGKFAIRPEFVPSLAAYFLMIGRVYQRAIDGMEYRLAIDTVPGLVENIAMMKTCQAHIQRLLDNLPTNFDGDDWRDAVVEICRLMGIEPTSTPLADVPEGTFGNLLAEAQHGTEPR